MAVGYLSDISFPSDDDEEIINFLQRPMRRPRVISDRTNYFALMDDKEFIIRFRLSKSTALIVLDHIQDQIEFPHDRNNSVTPMNQLLLSLRFYASGCHLITAGDFIGVHKSTACRIVHRVTSAIAGLRPLYVNLPSDPKEMMEIQREFYMRTRFPRILGCMDCTHVKIQSPGGDTPEIFRNRKGYFSINVQTICDADLNIRDIVARWYGSAHDTTIFNNCSKGAMFESGIYGNSLLLVDSGYPVRPYLLPPLENAVTPAEQLYNECRIRTGSCVERQYGVWKRRFPILALGIRVNIDKVPDIIVACAVLFNLSRKNGDTEPPNEIENLQAQIDEDQMPDGNQLNGALGSSSQGAGAIRRSIIDNYFQSLV